MNKFGYNRIIKLDRFAVLVCLRIVVSITYCVVFLVLFFSIVYPMLPVSLDCPFLITPHCILKHLLIVLANMENNTLYMYIAIHLIRRYRWNMYSFSKYWSLSHYRKWQVSDFFFKILTIQMSVKVEYSGVTLTLIVTSYFLLTLERFLSTPCTIRCKILYLK